MKAKDQLLVFTISVTTLVLIYDFVSWKFSYENLKPLYIFKAISSIPTSPPDSIADNIQLDSSNVGENTPSLKERDLLTDSKATKRFNFSKNTVWMDFSKDFINSQIIQSALENLKSDSTQFRIAYFSDSFTEGDILTTDFRDTLQSVFGGEGVGMVPITSPIAGFRRTLWSKAEGFKAFTFSPKKVAIGITGSTTIIENESNTATYVPKKPMAHAVVQLLYTATSSFIIEYKKNHEKPILDTIAAPTGFGLWKKEFPTLKSFNFKIKAKESPLLLGISFESKKGVLVDNFSMRGNSGIGIGQMDDNFMKRTEENLHYSMVVVHFGLNVAGENVRDYTFYKKAMQPVILKIKKWFPNAVILIASVNDRSALTDGEMKTMPSIPYLVQAQMELAKENECLFWNVFMTMGGDNSMVRWVEDKPAKANKDYTHINFAGGKVLGRRLGRLLMESIQGYENKSTVPTGDSLPAGP